VPVTEYAVPLTRVGWFRVWAPIEEVIAQYGRPRRGKTGQLIHWLLDAPGAVLATSTKVDLYHLTQGLRGKRGPVCVFNPTNIGDLPTTIAFDPLFECEDTERAEERAIDLISGGSAQADGDGKRWDNHAQRVLTGLLHAAALGGYSMTDVLIWVANPDKARREVMRPSPGPGRGAVSSQSSPDKPTKHSLPGSTVRKEGSAISLLRTSPRAGAFVPSAEQFFGTNDRTRSSVTFTIMPALAWLSNRHAVAATEGATQFNIERILADQATVYLLASRESRMGPLLSALTGYIAREAKRIAARSPGGRLDPPLRLILDEAANTCPVPLDAWLSDFGSHGITLCPAFQSLIGRWGIAGAGAIANNTGATVLHAYGSETQDLQHFMTLSGTRLDEHGHRVPVLSFDAADELAEGDCGGVATGDSGDGGADAPGVAAQGSAGAAQGLASRTLVAEMEEHLAAEAQRVSAQTADTPAAATAGRWAVDVDGLAERVGDQAALNGRAAGGAGDGVH
jgi:type IV secretion system protein VirD4